MSRLHEIRARRSELKPQILELGEADALTPEDEVRLDALIAEDEALETEGTPLEVRAAKVAKVAETVLPEARTEGGDGARFSAPNVIKETTPFDVLEDRSLSPMQRRKALVDSNIRAVEGKIEGADNEAHFEKLLRKHTPENPEWAAELLQRSRPEYTDAFMKMITGRAHALTEEERTALSTLTNANGKYAVPTHLDPSVILTNTGTSNAIRAISRVETLVGGPNVWNGLSSAGVTASWDTELSEVSDDSPTFVQPSISTYSARAFVQASIQATQDIAGLEGSLLTMFGDAKDRLEGAAHALGTGSGQPFGVFPGVVGTAGSLVVSASAAAIALADLNSVYAGLPVRYRGKSTWLMNPNVALAIKTLGTAISASYSGDLRDPSSSRILNRPVVESDDAPYVTTTTALDSRLILGDFSNYVIVDMPGSMTVEYIPHLFNTANNLPDGRRGWFAYWRTGADSVNDDAFRLLQDKTSA